jgi:hypothetical protein
MLTVLKRIERSPLLRIKTRFLSTEGGSLLESNWSKTDLQKQRNYNQI